MLICHSINHQNAPLAVREQLDFSEKSQMDWLCRLNQGDVVMLSTCNRLELYAFVDAPEAMDALWRSLLAEKGVDAGELTSYTSRLQDVDAARHLFEVAASLRSMALGEAQILGQVAEAHARAENCGHRMSMLFRGAIHAAKRVHSETRISLGNVSVSSLGIRKVEQRLGSLGGLSVLVVGAGEMGQAVLKGLKHRGNTASVHVVSRTFERARQVAQRWGVQARPITHLKDLLLAADVVFTTSGAPFPILNYEDIQPIMEARGGRPLHIVDIAIPRDVAAQVGEIPGVLLDNLDDLQQVIAENHREREKAIPGARHIIDEELARFWADYQGLDAVPTIQQIRAQADHIRQQELQRIYNKLSDNGAEDLSQLFEEFSHRFMNKMLHQPTQSLRTRAGNGNAALFTSVARDLFGLEDA